MVEGKYIHIEIVIPKTALWSRKAALRESNFKRYGRSRMYTQLYTYKIWFPKRPFRARKQLYGNQISRGMVEAECIHNYTLIKFDSQNGPFEPESSFMGIKFPMCIHSPSTIPLEIWFPQSFFLAQKGRFGNQISYVYTLAFYHTSGNLIPVKLLSGSKWPIWESDFLCVYTSLLPYLWKFDSRKASFWLEMAVLGIKFPMCIHSASTILWAATAADAHWYRKEQRY